MSIATKRGVCAYCGHNHDKIMFHSLPTPDEKDKRIKELEAQRDKAFNAGLDAAIGAEVSNPYPLTLKRYDAIGRAFAEGRNAKTNAIRALKAAGVEGEES